MKYIQVDVYSNSNTNASNGGITVTHPNDLVIECKDGYITHEQVLRDGLIVLTFETIQTGKTLHTIAKVKNEDKTTCNGGNFIYSSDSRFRKMYTHPISVHDCIE